jgi:serine kinase of HPr protein (carbohydrate metabolism regulator)
MKIEDLVKDLNLEVSTGHDFLGLEVTGGYASDLLSDVLANATKGNIWITLQTHLNIVAVARLKEISGIIIVNGREPKGETIMKAEQEKIPILISQMSTYQLAGKLYELGIK